jgi:hypothetical protein
MMKIIGKGAIKGEKGSVLPLVLVLLVLGGLILTPLLGLMGTGLGAGQVYEKKTDELYAADAGVEDAIWRIQDGTEVKHNCPTDPTSWNYTISDVNDKSVAVNITYVNNITGKLTYRIVSTATTPGTGSSTTLESYVKYGPPSEDNIFSNPIFSAALASAGDLKLDVGCTVNGDLYYCGKLDAKDYTIDGETISCNATFPTQEQIEDLRSSLEEQARAVEPPPAGDMEITSNTSLGPIYIDGDLTIWSVTLTLTGVVYVTGNILAKHDSVITGSGSLVAEGTIQLMVNTDYSVTGEDSILMSLSNSNEAIKFMTQGLSVESLIYAPYGGIKFDGNTIVSGGVVGQYIYGMQHCTFGTESTIYAASEESSLEIETYSVSP